LGSYKVFNENGFRNDGAHSAGSQQPQNGRNKMDNQNDQVAHA
jgi:hypothetical protein